MHFGVLAVHELRWLLCKMRLKKFSSAKFQNRTIPCWQGVLWCSKRFVKAKFIIAHKSQYLSLGNHFLAVWTVERTFCASVIFLESAKVAHEKNCCHSLLRVLQWNLCLNTLIMKGGESMQKCTTTNMGLLTNCTYFTCSVIVLMA